MGPTDLARNFNLTVSGLIHVGANIGDERDQYRQAEVPAVLWVEPIPAVYAQLTENIRGYTGQRAVQAVCTSTAGERVVFHVASNGGASSSVLELGLHADLYPAITYQSELTLESTTVDYLVAEAAAPAPYNMLVMDVQGAELIVLQGALKTLEQCDAVYLEVSEAPLYEGGCTLEQLIAFLKPLGFRIKWLELNSLNWGNAFFVHGGKNMATLAPPPGPNLALGRTTRQSSVYPADHSNPVDGAISGRFGFHTDWEQKPWWEVDLDVSQALQELRIFNRGDACQIRARSLQVLLSDDTQNWRVVYERGGLPFGMPGRNAGRPLQINVHGQSARYVRLQLAEAEFFHLDEVEVY